MTLFFSVLASSSKANCTYVETKDCKILIDCGLSARETEKRLTSLGIDPKTISHIFVTHEHSDHIRGVSVLSRRHSIPVYCNGLTGQFVDDVHKKVFFRSGETIKLGKNTEVHTCSILHDAVDPVAFSVETQNSKLAHLTDTGTLGSDIEKFMMGANAIVIESNYDELLLDQCEYPWSIKERITSSHGHISNCTAAKFIEKIAHKNLKHVILAHLSERSNTADVASDTFHQECNSIHKSLEVRIGSHYSPTPILACHGSDQNLPYSTNETVAA